AYCKKKTDTVKPVLTLIGATNDTLSLNSPYVELGAMAMDDVDGNISSAVVITGNVDMNKAGSYPVTYNVKDAAGNAATPLTRNVTVRNDADYLTGWYNAKPNCGATATSTFVTQVKASDVVNNRIEFTIGSYFTASNPVIEVVGNNINVQY